MNFVTFSANTTNIFPIANTTKGGQLVTEFNLRARESVATDPNVKYMIGPSYTHSMEDFSVSIQTDELGIKISSTTLQINPGRCVLNGHYVENLAPMLIDINIANANALKNKSKIIEGKCCIGLIAMYSKQATIAGSIKAENDEEMYEGVQVVILPESEFILPTDKIAYNDPTNVTAHLKLAEFTYRQQRIESTSIKQNADKTKNIDGKRIYNIDEILSDKFVGKSKLNPHKLYVYATKNINSSNDLEDTWCDANDALMVWDNNPTEADLTSSSFNPREARFGIDVINGTTQLVIPHKQIDGMKNQNGQPKYYIPKVLNLPVADYEKEMPGTITKPFIKSIKAISDKIKNLEKFNVTGNFRGVINILSDISELPEVKSQWDIGDWILVNTDEVVGQADDTARDPSTMYMVTPGYVKKIEYVGNSTEANKKPSGICLDTYPGDNTEPNITDADTYNKKRGEGGYWDFSVDKYKGIVNSDYFTYIQTNDENTEVTEYYYVVKETSAYTWSDAILLTAEIPYASEDLIGGFKNVSNEALNSGYVRLDENGHLYLLDYDLLRSGVLAYQLGEDYVSPSGLTNSEIQEELDDYVNQRVAFANNAHIVKASEKNSTTDVQIINITLDLTPSENPSSINIRDIDSRFNTSIYLHINGTADNNTTINIFNCEKIRIDSNIGGTEDGKIPVINLYNSSLYYDADVLDKLNNVDGLSLWYKRYGDTDPNLLVNGMTVQAVDAAIIPEELDYWNTAVPNDNHIRYALQSVTFGPDASIIGFGILIQNSTTANISTGKSIITSNKFNLPQGASLSYPITRLKSNMRLTGSFVSAYPTLLDNNTKSYIVMSSQFTAITGKYDINSKSITDGTIAMYIDTNIVDNIVGVETLGTSIDGWDTNSYHIFTGGALS